MNLKEIREWFIRDSGRFDLVVDTTTWADKGADKYIAAGQKFLDRLTESSDQFARVFRILTVGQHAARFQNTRRIDSVWAATPTEQWELRRVSYKEMREHIQGMFSESTNSKPAYWCPAFFRLNQFDTDPLTDGYSGYMDVMPDWKEFNGVIIQPAPDTQMQLEITGKFFSEAMTTDEDECHWSVNEPSLLVKAALRELEVFYRNTQGVNDWERAIRTELLGLEKDFIEYEYGHIDQMEG